MDAMPGSRGVGPGENAADPDRMRSKLQQQLPGNKRQHYRNCVQALP